MISKKDYVLVPGAAVESEIVLNNAAGNRRQVIHVIEVDPSNPDVSIVPGYNQIDKLIDDPNNEAYWSHKELTDMAKYYEDNLGYNIVGGMNTDIYYDTYAPRVLVYNGQDLSVKGKYAPSSSILYVFRDAEGNISCDVKAYNKADFEKYLADGTLLHAVGGSSTFLTKHVGEDTFTMRSIVNRNNPKEGYRVYTFGEDGKLLDEMLDANGIITSEVDGMFWVVNGKTAYGGLMLIDGDYYYARSSGEILTNRTYWITKTNDLLPAANYTFGADGRMIDPPAA